MANGPRTGPRDRLGRRGVGAPARGVFAKRATMARSPPQPAPSGGLTSMGAGKEVDDGARGSTG